MIVFRSKKFLLSLIENGVEDELAKAIVRRGLNILLIRDGLTLAYQLFRAEGFEYSLFTVPQYDDIDNPKFNAARIKFGCVYFARNVRAKMKIDRIVKLDLIKKFSIDEIGNTANLIKESKKEPVLNIDDIVEIIKIFRKELKINELIEAKSKIDRIPRTDAFNVPFKEEQFKEILQISDFLCGEEIPGNIKQSTGILSTTDKNYVANRIRATLKCDFISNFDKDSVETLKLSIGVIKEKSQDLRSGSSCKDDPSIPDGWKEIWSRIKGLGPLPHFQPAKYIESKGLASKDGTDPILDEDFFAVMNRDLSEEVIEKLNLRTEKWRELVGMIQGNEQIKNFIIAKVPDWHLRAQSLAAEKIDVQSSSSDLEQAKQCETVLAAIATIWNMKAPSKIPQAIKFFEDFKKLDVAVDVKKMKKDLWNDVFKEMSERYNADPSQYQWVNNFIAGLNTNADFVENFKKNFKSQVKMGIIADPKTDPFVVDLIYEARKAYFND